MELEKQMKKMFGKQRGHRIFFFFYGYTMCSCCSGFSLVAVNGSYSLIAVQLWRLLVLEHRLEGTAFSRCITRAPLF